MKREDKIKKYLTKEASQRVSMAQSLLTKIGMEDESLKKELMQEANDKLFRIKHRASLGKESMAFSSGYRSLRTATDNLSWRYPEIGKRSAAIMKAIEDSFNVYRKGTLGKGKSHPVQSGLYWEPFVVDEVESGSAKLEAEPMATFVMRFAYTRHILPIETADSYKETMSAVESVNEFFAKNGIDFNILQFITDIEQNNIPLYPYFGASDLNEERGGAITEQEISAFLLEEVLRARKQPDSAILAGTNHRNWFAPHLHTIRENQPIRMTASHRADMQISNDDVGALNWDSELLRAIANKVQQGYALNVMGLEKDLHRESQEVKKTTRAEDTAILDQDYQRRLNKIIREFTKGLEVQFMDDVDEKKLHSTAKPSHSYHWGLEKIDERVGYRVGLATTGAKRNRKAIALSFRDLQLLLKNLTFEASRIVPQLRNRRSPNFDQDYMSFALRERKKFGSSPNSFLLKGRSVVFSANGLDSNPWERGGRMPLIPSVKKIPASEQGPGEVIYDSDNANMGRNQLVKNWYQMIKDPGNNEWVQEPALEGIIQTWGAKADAALRSLSQSSFQDENANKAWALVSKNRTNADSTYDTIQQYSGNWDAFNNEVLSRPLATAINRYYGHFPQLEFSEENKALFEELKGGSPLDVKQHAAFANKIFRMAKHLQSNPIIGSLLNRYPDEISARDFLKGIFEACKNNIPEANPLLGAIMGYRRSGDWNALVEYMQNNGFIDPKNTDMNTRMDQRGFDTWSKYGYQLGKMMDFVDCLMNTCSGEVYERKARGKAVYDEIYGRNRSSSSGKGNGGQVMIGIRYAYNAGEVADYNTEEGQRVIGMINNERKRRHDAYQIKGPTYRKSSNWERLGEKVVNIGRQLVSIGEHEDLPTGAATPDATAVKVVKVIENLEFFIGHAGSEDGWLRQLESGTDWKALLSSFNQRYPTLQGMLNVLISPIQARFDILEVNAKKAIDNVRRRLEEELSTPSDVPGGKVSIEVHLSQQMTGESVLSADAIADSAKVLGNKIDDMKSKDPNENVSLPEEAAPEEIEAPETKVQEPTPVIPPTAPAVVDTTETGPITTIEELEGEPTPPPIPEEVPERQPNEMPRPKPMEQTPGFVGKNKSKRTLVRRSPVRGIVNRSTVINKLEKIADELDKRGIILLSDKVDLILKKISEES